MFFPVHRTIDIAHRLLAVDAQKHSANESRVRMLPAVLAIFNLLFCAYAERFLHDDPDGRSLSLFLFLECSLLVIVAVGSFSRHSHEILMKSAVFPTTAWSRFLFVVWSAMRRPASAALWSTTTVFFLVWYRQSVLMIAAGVTFFIFSIINLELLIAILCLRSFRASQPLAGIAVFGFFGILAILISSLVFRFDILLSATPIVSWAASGMVAAGKANYPLMLRSLLLMMLTTILLLAAGRKFS